MRIYTIGIPDLNQGNINLYLNRNIEILLLLKKSQGNQRQFLAASRSYAY